ncbi:MAG TPA: hypothetical protein VKA46_42230 [Gemmataceae bacterium]|nr:hypothetical protein [Gemmataceae bacterium]
MDLILIDWTRMGRAYCLAGVVVEGQFARTVRPLLSKCRDAPVRNVGWSPYLLDGHQRWEVFELVGPATADPQPPHVEDTWVRALQPRRYSATPEQRRAILQSLAARPGEVLFGTPLLTTRASAYLRPGTGQRSLVTLIVPSVQVGFSACQRQGAAEADVRATIGVLPLANRPLPLKDHHLLLRAEQAARNLNGLAPALTRLVREMGEQVAVRLGVSRPFQASPQRDPGLCWLMVDGIFSLSNPQP